MEGLGCINSSLGNFVKPYRVKSRGASKKAKSRSASEKAKSRGTSKNRPTLMFLVSTTAFLGGNGIMKINYELLVLVL